MAKTNIGWNASCAKQPRVLVHIESRASHSVRLQDSIAEVMNETKGGDN